MRENPKKLENLSLGRREFTSGAPDPACGSPALWPAPMYKPHKIDPFHCTNKKVDIEAFINTITPMNRLDLRSVPLFVNFDHSDTLKIAVVLKSLPQLEGVAFSLEEKYDDDVITSDISSDIPPRKRKARKLVAPQFLLFHLPRKDKGKGKVVALSVEEEEEETKVNTLLDLNASSHDSAIGCSPMLNPITYLNTDENSHGLEARVLSCNYCQRKFYNSQALGGHQNAHKREGHCKERSEIRNNFWDTFSSLSPSTLCYYGFSASAWKLITMETSTYHKSPRGGVGRFDVVKTKLYSAANEEINGYLISGITRLKSNQEEMNHLDLSLKL
ncbi:hypothetical protein Fmac_000670 [Flemingia macrophylla]|uniref:C2H2-type domain-containing protein n=1 Tax=Flemingia macrophylla TaxID=520843 RepID=A0ABD1NHN2_9FABA